MHQPTEFDPRDTTWLVAFRLPISKEYFESTVPADVYCGIDCFGGFRPMLRTYLPPIIERAKR